MGPGVEWLDRFSEKWGASFGNILFQTHGPNNNKCLVFQEVDFAAADFDITKSRFEVVDFMEPFEENAYALAIKIPREDNYSVFVRVFKVTKPNQSTRGMWKFVSVSWMINIEQEDTRCAERNFTQTKKEISTQ